MKSPMRSGTLTTWVVGLILCATPVPAAVQVGDKPSLRVTALDGSTIDLSNHKGKLVLIDFWSGKSQTTVKAQARVKEAYEKYKDLGLVVIGINCDARTRDLESNIAEMGLNFPQYHEPTGKKGGLYKEWGVPKLPYYFLLAPDGAVVYAGYKTAIDDVVYDYMSSHPPELVDDKALAKATEAIEATEKALAENDPHEALRHFAQIDEKARKDARLNKRCAAVTKKIGEAADVLLAEVDQMLADKHFVEAAGRLKELAKALASSPRSADVKKRQGELAANPEAKAVLEKEQKQAAADSALIAAQKLHEDGHSDEAYLKLKSLASDYPDSQAARSAAEQIAKYESDPALMRKINERSIESKAKAALSMADGYRHNGKTELARVKYEQIAKDFPNTSFADEARKALSALK